MEFDPEKDARNVARHGLSLADFAGFDDKEIVQVDDRLDYGETRFVARGRIGGVPHAVVFTWRGENDTQIGLSLADAIQFFVCRFFTRRGEKTTHNNSKVPCCRRRTCCEQKS